MYTYVYMYWADVILPKPAAFLVPVTLLQQLLVLYIYMYIYVYICIYMYVYIYTYVYV